MKDSTIRSFLSGEQEEEDAVTTVAPPSDTSQHAPSDSTITLAQSPVVDAPVVHKDPRITRSVEIRKELMVLKNRLTGLEGRRKSSHPDSGSLAIESENLEIQMEGLEDEYARLYGKGLAIFVVMCDHDFGFVFPGSGLRPSDYENISISIKRTSEVETSVLRTLTGCLHPDSPSPHFLNIRFPLSDDGVRKRPQKATLDLLNRYGFEYTTTERGGLGIRVTIPT
ncbi:hypothetical protein BDN72DRAFT_907199 [Pluteus cervinus]|uniref:Uncharacterized protein n=1 Tax=Pluteus cervinus TaxID=181527 RepID=A0ACD2ZWW7_9AGAR|nr:hypothetical protein BDN72DRAFT_907199 [Pluteus cervinus]